MDSLKAWVGGGMLKHKLFDGTRHRYFSKYPPNSRHWVYPHFFFCKWHWMDWCLAKQNSKGSEGRLRFYSIVNIICGISGSRHHLFNYMLTIQGLFLDMAVMSFSIPSGYSPVGSRFAALKRTRGGLAYCCEWCSLCSGLRNPMRFVLQQLNPHSDRITASPHAPFDSVQPQCLWSVPAHFKVV